MQQPQLIDIFPVLEINSDYYIRQPDVKDAERYLSYYSNPDVHGHILASVPKNIADATQELTYSRNVFHNRRGVYWSIASKEDDFMVGAIGLYVNNFHRRAEICYDLAEEYWRQGIMNRTIAVVKDYAFTQLKLLRIEAIIMKENAGSEAVLRINGFEREATLRNYKFFKNKSYDVELYSVTP